MLAPMSSIDRAVRKYYFGERIGRRPRLGDPLSSIPSDIPLAAPPPRSVPNRSRDAAFPDPLPEPEDHSLGTIAPEGSAPDAVQELKTLIIRLEKTVTAQSRAFRALVDLLQDKGVVRRGELGQRTARK
jgi:hypothetical protein